MTENEKVGWHHRLNGYEFEQTSGDSGRQGSPGCCSQSLHVVLMTHKLEKYATYQGEQQHAFQTDCITNFTSLQIWQKEVVSCPFKICSVLSFACKQLEPSQYCE